MGEYEYMNSCAQCHGVSGAGDGPVSDFLSGAVPPDLTVLQANNGGVFPISAVYAVLEGGTEASAHGTMDMPIWGDRYRTRAEASEDLGQVFTPAESEAYARNRILALIEYLSTLQVQ